MEKRAWDAWKILLDVPCSRGELATRLGVSQMTAGRTVNRLLQMGMVTERIEKRERGRPRRVVSLSAKWQYWIVSVDGASCEATCVRANGEILYRIEAPLEVGMEPWDSLANFLGRLRMTYRLIRGLAEPRAMALILHKEAVGMSSVGDEFDLVIEEDYVEIRDVCERLNRIMLLRE